MYIYGTEGIDKFIDGSIYEVVKKIISNFKY